MSAMSDTIHTYNWWHVTLGKSEASNTPPAEWNASKCLCLGRTRQPSMNSPLTALINCVTYLFSFALTLPRTVAQGTSALYTKSCQHANIASEHYELKWNSRKSQLWHEVSQFRLLTTIQLQLCTSVYRKVWRFRFIELTMIPTITTTTWVSRNSIKRLTFFSPFHS